MQKFHGAKVIGASFPGNESSQGAKVLFVDFSLPGMKMLQNRKSIFSYQVLLFSLLTLLQVMCILTCCVLSLCDKHTVKVLFVDFSLPGMKMLQNRKSIFSYQVLLFSLLTLLQVMCILTCGIAIGIVLHFSRLDWSL